MSKLSEVPDQCSFLWKLKSVFSATSYRRHLLQNKLIPYFCVLDSSKESSKNELLKVVLLNRDDSLVMHPFDANRERVAESCACGKGSLARVEAQ